MKIKRNLLSKFSAVVLAASLTACAAQNTLSDIPAEQRAELLLQSAEQGYQDGVSALLKAGADVNYVRDDGSTALSRAAEKGRLPIVKMLIRAGADVNHSLSGQSLLMHIVDNNDLLMAQVFIAAGADVNFVAEDGKTALSIAQEKRFRDLEMLLRQSGAQS